MVWAPNMSIGVTLLAAMVEPLAAPSTMTYDIEIVEMHHRHKVDAPSGTALGAGPGRGARGATCSSMRFGARAATARPARGPRGEIGFATLRGGDVVGDHTVIFAADGERIESATRRRPRQVFAKGAVRAARWAGRANRRACTP